MEYSQKREIFGVLIILFKMSKTVQNWEKFDEIEKFAHKNWRRGKCKCFRLWSLRRDFHSLYSFYQFIESYLIVLFDKQLSRS